MPKYRIIPIGGGGITPEGTLNIRSEGVFDVTDYASVDVDIFDDTTTKTITNNGTYNASDDHVLGYSQVTVDVPASAVDSGTKSDTITINGTSTIDVVGYASHEVTVAVPASAVDYGTKQITSNGNGQDVVGYAAVDVNVPNGTETITVTNNGTYTPTSPNIGFSEVTVNVPVPSGSVTLTQNRAYNVSAAAVAIVSVPASEVDTGTKQITTNGTHDVIGYASVDVNVAVQTEPDYLKITRTDSNNNSTTINLVYTKRSVSETFFPVIEYSRDKQTWTRVNSDNYTISVQKGDEVYFRGNNPTGLSNGVPGNYMTINCGGGSYLYSFSVSGSLCTLISYTENRTDAPVEYCFMSLFRANYGLVDASNLILPKSIKANGLGGMFNGCTRLVTPPNIDIKVVEASGFSGMFNGCTSLATPPQFNGSIAHGYAFQNMFKGCTKLVTPMDLTDINFSAIGSSLGHCESMYEGCTKLTRTALLNKYTSYQSAHMYMYKGCTSLTNATVTATSAGKFVFSHMFEGCTSLTEVDLNFPTNAQNCIGNMFYNCANLSKITFRASSFISTNSTDWVSGVSATGDFYNLGGATIPTGTNGIPSGWTEHTSL